MRNRWNICMMLTLALCVSALSGCKRETAEVTVPLAEAEELPEELPEVSQTEEQEEAEIALETAAGTVLGEEEVVLLLEGEAESKVCTRIQGNGEFSLAYDPEQFSVRASEEELYLEALEYGRESATPVFISFQAEEAASSEELVEQLVSESDEECIVEEITIGEGEYPAVWVSFAEGTAADSRTCDYYVLRHNETLYVVQMDCFLEAYEGLGGTQQMILSTLRFHEG